MKTTIENTKVNTEMLAVPADHYGFWERRMKIDDIFMELALPWNTECNVVEIYNEIVNYCKAYNVMPRNVSWNVVDGILTADGKNVKRVGPKDYRPSYSAEADYWEARCLSMGEPVD